MVIERKKVGLGIENPFIQVNLMVVCEQKIKILERLPEEEGLHHVLGSRVDWVLYVADGGVPAAHLGVALYALETVGCKIKFKTYSFGLSS